MKLDKGYTFIRRCPKTKQMLSSDQHAYSSGVCPRCGHVADGTFTHVELVTGRWNRPSAWEWLMGKRKQFIEEQS